MTVPSAAVAMGIASLGCPAALRTLSGAFVAWAPAVSGLTGATASSSGRVGAGWQRPGEVSSPPSPSPQPATSPSPTALGMLGCARRRSHRLLPPAPPLAGCWQGMRGFAAQAEPQQQGPSAGGTGAGDKAKAEAAEGSATQQQQQQPLPRPPNDAVYEGPLSQQHKLLKRISIANTLVAAAAAPAIVMFADNISLVSRYGLAASLVFFGMVTTGALHWVAHPYVHELRYTAATGQVRVRTTTLLGFSRWHTFHVDDVQPLPWNRPVATFTALGRFYYIDVYSFDDQQLLRRLTPDEADVPQGYKDKDEDDD